MFSHSLPPILKMFPPFQTLFIKLHQISPAGFAIYTRHYTAMSLYCTVEIEVKCMPQENDTTLNERTNQQARNHLNVNKQQSDKSKLHLKFRVQSSPLLNRTTLKKKKKKEKTRKKEKKCQASMACNKAPHTESGQVLHQII